MAAEDPVGTGVSDKDLRLLEHSLFFGVIVDEEAAEGDNPAGVDKRFTEGERKRAKGLSCVSCHRPS